MDPIAFEEVQPASRSKRLAAWIIDAACTNVLALPMAPIIVIYNGEELPAVVVLAMTGGCTVAVFVAAVLFDGGQRGATPGKRFVGTRVIDSLGRGPIGLRRAAVRRAVYVLGGLLLYVGWIWLLLDPRRQAWHDKAAHTLVVKAR